MSDQRCPENPPHQPTLAWEFVLPDSQCLRTFCSLVFFGWSAFKLQKTVKFLQSERTISNHFHYFLEGRSVALGKIYLCDGTSEHCVPGVMPLGHDCHALLFFLGVDGNMLLRCRFFFFFSSNPRSAQRAQNLLRNVADFVEDLLGETVWPCQRWFIYLFILVLRCKRTAFLPKSLT